MKETVLKLINSGNYIDILIGIELSYNLSLEDFESIFLVETKNQLINSYEGPWFAFGRGNHEYHITNDNGVVYIYGGKTGLEHLNTPNFNKGWKNVKYSET